MKRLNAASKLSSGERQVAVVGAVELRPALAARSPARLVEQRLRAVHADDAVPGAGERDACGARTRRARRRRRRRPRTPASLRRGQRVGSRPGVARVVDVGAQVEVAEERVPGLGGAGRRHAGESKRPGSVPVGDRDVAGGGLGADDARGRRVGPDVERLLAAAGVGLDAVGLARRAPGCPRRPTRSTRRRRRGACAEAEPTSPEAVSAVTSAVARSLGGDVARAGAQLGVAATARARSRRPSRCAGPPGRSARRALTSPEPVSSSTRPVSPLAVRSPEPEWTSTGVSRRHADHDPRAAGAEADVRALAVEVDRGAVADGARPRRVDRALDGRVDGHVRASLELAARP